MNRNKLRRSFRLGFGVVIIEGVIYFFEMLMVASRLHGGVAAGTAHAAGSIFGLQAFSAVRHGYHSQITTATWVVPAMIALPLVIGAVAYFLPGRRGRGRIRAHAMGAE